MAPLSLPLTDGLPLSRNMVTTEGRATVPLQSSQSEFAGLLPPSQSPTDKGLALLTPALALQAGLSLLMLALVQTHVIAPLGGYSSLPNAVVAAPIFNLLPSVHPGH